MVLWEIFRKTIYEIRYKKEDAAQVLVIRDGISTFAELQDLLIHAHDYDQTILGIVAVEE